MAKVSTWFEVQKRQNVSYMRKGTIMELKKYRTKNSEHQKTTFEKNFEFFLRKKYHSAGKPK